MAQGFRLSDVYLTVVSQMTRIGMSEIIASLPAKDQEEMARDIQHYVDKPNNIKSGWVSKENSPTEPEFHWVWLVLVLLVVVIIITLPLWMK
jgi:hypothetical protein